MKLIASWEILFGLQIGICVPLGSHAGFDVSLSKLRLLIGDVSCLDVVEVVFDGIPISTGDDTVLFFLTFWELSLGNVLVDGFLVGTMLSNFPGVFRYVLCLCVCGFSHSAFADVGSFVMVASGLTTL